MTPELFDAFGSELSAIARKIAVQRADLEQLEEGEECAIVRHRIAALESLTAAIAEARTKIMAAETHAEDTVNKFRVWRERLMLARDAKVAVDAFAKPIEDCQVELDQAEHRYQVAQAAFTDHLNHPLENRNYASQSAVRKWDSRSAELESALGERSSELRVLKQKIADLRNGWLRATKDFNRAAFDERMARLPHQATKPQGFGTLAAVG